jgi:hypothetical protein
VSTALTITKILNANSKSKTQEGGLGAFETKEKEKNSGYD